MEKESADKSAVCKSIFRSKSVTKELYTQKWAELINALEKAKMREIR